MLSIKNICICTDISINENTGATDRITHLAKSASKKETKIFLIDRSLNKSFSSLIIDSDKYYEYKNGVRIDHTFPLSIRFLFPGIIKLTQEILNRLISLVTLSFSPAVCLSFIVDPYLFVKLFFVCRSEHVDVLQSEFHVTVPTCFVGKKMLNLPLIYDSHNVEAQVIADIEKISPLYIAATKIVEKTGCMASDFVFAVSEQDKKTFASWGIPQEKIAVIPNSVDVKQFSNNKGGEEVRKRLGLLNDFVLIFHGTLGYPPNREAAILSVKEIVPSISKYYPNVALLLVGKNPPEISSSKVIIAGFVENLADYLDAADIAIVPMLKGGGTRIKILEYMASGKAIVSTFKGAEGIDLKNGSEALLTEKPDKKFVDSILFLIENSALKETMGINARKKAELLYDWSKTSDKAIAVYFKLGDQNK